MTDQLPEQLSETFESTAGSVDVPLLPLADVLARGRRLQQVRRRRTAIWTAAAAAVAVVAVSLPLALAGHGAKRAPAPAHHSQKSSPSPHASPATLPYLARHELHADGRTIRTDATTILSRGGTTYVSTDSTESSGWTWSHLVDGRLKQVSELALSRDQPWLGWHGEELSPDGSLLVVVTYPTQDSTRVIAYDTTDDSEIAHVDLALPFSNWTGGGDSLTLLGVDAKQQAYWVQEPTEGKGPETDWVWRPGHGDPVELGDPFARQPYGMFQVTPAGPVVAGTLGAVDGGQWQAVGDVPGSGGAAWSPSGDTVARGGGSPALLTPANGGSVTPDLPAPLVRWVGFESDTDVLGVVGSRDHAQLVRCHPADGACELIQDLPATWKSWRWATNGPSGPNSSTPAPNTTQPTEPFIEGTTLHAHGLTFEVGRHTNLVAAGTTVLVGHWGKSITWRTLRDDRLVPLPYGTGAVPVLSPDGRRVAVSTNPTQQTSRITVYDGRTDAVIAHVDLALPATCCDGGSVQQLSVDDDGTVHWVEDRGPEAPAMTWRPGSAPVRVGSAGS